MSAFALPKGFTENETAILVPSECFEEFLAEVQNQGYKVDPQHLLSWANIKARENLPVYFHFKNRDSIQAFCYGSQYCHKLKLINYDDLFPETYVDVLALL